MPLESTQHPQNSNQAQAQLLAQALGLPVFQSPWYTPNYPQGVRGAWRLVHGATGLDRGYFSGPCVTTGMTALLRQNQHAEWETWMSLSPFEIESQELTCRHAFGHTVVMGLGMGWVAANIALNAQVTRVTVVERDPDVLALFQQSGVIEGLPEHAAAKIELVQADALTWTSPTARVDFLHADIWLKVAEPQALSDVQRMQANLNAQQVYFWGQEVVLTQNASVKPNHSCWPQALAQAIHQTRLPLLGEQHMDYAHWTAQVWQTGADQHRW